MVVPELTSTHGGSRTIEGTEMDRPGRTQPADLAPGRSASILIVDRHAIMRAALCRLLETQPGIEVVGEAGDSRTAAQCVRALAPDLVLLSFDTPGAYGLACLRSLGGGDKKPRIIILSARLGPREVAQWLKLGASGFIAKESSASILFQCIHSVRNGGYWLDGGRTPGEDDSAGGPSKAGQPRESILTCCEMKIATEIVHGATNKEIAVKYRISANTVRNHLAAIFDKTGVSNRTELALFCINHDLVRLD